jgi:sugar lactone lactonase YvrE
VLIFAPNSSIGVTIAGNGVAGSLPYQLNCPNGIFVDDYRNLYIADYQNHRVQMWRYQSTSGITVAGNGTAGSSLSQLNQPTAVVVDTNGYMYITEEGNNRIIRWKLNSDSGICIVACTGTGGNAMNQLKAPVSIAFDSNGSLYTSDYFNNRVQKFQFLYDESKNLII